MMRYPPLSIEYIRSRLRVNLSTGKCYWKDATKHHRNLVGKEAGCPRNGRGNQVRWVIKIDGRGYLRSQIIYAVMTGKWPKSCVDHKNSNTLDDRGVNLREATFMENARHRRIGVDGRSLPMGVRIVPSGRFQARININKKQKALGCFDSIDAAEKSYRSARVKHFMEFS